MKYLIPILLLLVSYHSYGQKHHKKVQDIPDSVVIKKWMRATINIEGRHSFGKYRQQLDSLEMAGAITFQQQVAQLDTLDKNSDAGSGTGIFLKYNGRHFLITARHVLVDTLEGDSNSILTPLILREINGVQNDLTQFHALADTAVANGQTEFIFRNNILITGAYDHIELRFSNSSDYSIRPYIFTSADDDLALIDLDGCDTGFVSTLYKRRYEPVELSDIDTTTDIPYGSSLIAIGFPRLSFIAMKNLDFKKLRWQSNIITTHFTAEGAFKAIIPNTNKFEAAIFIDHGFSGGPVIYENKLVGVNDYAYSYGYRTSVPENDRAFQGYNSYRSGFIRSSAILPLLRDLLYKESLYKESRPFPWMP